MRKTSRFVILLLLILFSCSSCVPAVVENNQTPVITKNAPTIPIVEGFYAAGPALKAKLEKIALADAGIQTLIQNKDFTLTAGGQEIENKDYNIAVGVRLKDGLTSEQFNAWLDNGREDTSLVKEYVGVLNIGYNAGYDIVFDMEKETVSALVEQGKSSVTIPEATAEDKQKALDIAMADATLQQILEGKSYRIAPEGNIGVWHTGDVKLGVAFEITFNTVYHIEADLPRYEAGLSHFSGDVVRLNVSVLLGENRVATIFPMSPMDGE
jgi:hypothetical protein